MQEAVAEVAVDSLALASSVTAHTNEEKRSFRCPVDAALLPAIPFKNDLPLFWVIAAAPLAKQAPCAATSSPGSRSSERECERDFP